MEELRSSHAPLCRCRDRDSTHPLRSPSPARWSPGVRKGHMGSNAPSCFRCYGKGSSPHFPKIIYGEEMSFMSLKLSDLGLGGRAELSWGVKQCCWLLDICCQDGSQWRAKGPIRSILLGTEWVCKIGWETVCCWVGRTFALSLLVCISSSVT